MMTVVPRGTGGRIRPLVNFCAAIMTRSLTPFSFNEINASGLRQPENDFPYAPFHVSPAGGQDEPGEKIGISGQRASNIDLHDGLLCGGSLRVYRS